MLNSDPAAKNRKSTSFEHIEKHKEPVLSQAPAPIFNRFLEGPRENQGPRGSNLLDVRWHGLFQVFRQKKKKKKSTLKECVPEPKNQTLTVELFYSLLLLTRLTFQGCPFETKTNIGIQLTRWRSFPSKQKPCLEIEAWLNRCPEIGLVLFSVVAHDGTKVK